MRRLSCAATGVPFCVAGWYFQRLTASTAARSNTWRGSASSTLTSSTLPSGVMVKLTSTQPSWLARTAVVG